MTRTDLQRIDLASPSIGTRFADGAAGESRCQAKRKKLQRSGWRVRRRLVMRMDLANRGKVAAVRHNTCTQPIWHDSVQAHSRSLMRFECTESVASPFVTHERRPTCDTRLAG